MAIYMKKKILITIFILALFLLIPSIPAMQQNIINEGLKKETQEKLDLFNINILEDIKESDGIRYPILLALVSFIYRFRFERGFLLFCLSTKLIDGRPPQFELKNPLLFFRSIFLVISAEKWYFFWMRISKILGWNWDI